MQIVLDASFATLALTEAVRGGYLADSDAFAIRDQLTANDVGEAEAALIPAGEIGALQETHEQLPMLAIVFDKIGPVALRTPVRPDEVEQTPIQLVDLSSSGEMLARATLDPFFGITPAGFHREPVTDAQAVVVEGVLALTPPEAGFNEDLARAWFILTAEPYVSHVLVVPKGISADDLAAVQTSAQALTTAAVEQRRLIRTRVVEATGLDRDRLTALFQATRWSLTKNDRRALLMLLQLGNKRGEVGPYVSQLAFAGE